MRVNFLFTSERDFVGSSQLQHEAQRNRPNQMTPTDTKPATKTEQLFWSRMHKLRQRGIELKVERKDGDKYFGSSVSCSTYNNGVFLSWTLQRAGGLNKKTTVRKFAQIDMMKADFPTAMRRFEYSF